MEQTIIQVIKREERLKRCLVSHHRGNKLNYIIQLQPSEYLALGKALLSSKSFEVVTGFELDGAGVFGLP